MSYTYQPYKRFVCQLQVVDPYINNISSYYKLRLNPTKCYQIKNQLEQGIKARLGNRFFLDYSKYATASDGALGQAQQNGNIPINQLIGQMIGTVGEPAQQLYTRTRTGPSRGYGAQLIQRGFRNYQRPRNQGAQQIQRYARGRQARQQQQAQRQNQGAITMQRYARGLQGRNRANQQAQARRGQRNQQYRRNEATNTIQRFMRGRQGRQQANRARRAIPAQGRYIPAFVMQRAVMNPTRGRPRRNFNQPYGAQQARPAQFN